MTDHLVGADAHADAEMKTDAPTGNPGVFDWRKHLKVHPAAELFPLMTEAELKELAEDITKTGMSSPIVVIWKGDACFELLDGRNRLDALALAGNLLVDLKGRLCTKQFWSGGDGLGWRWDGRMRLINQHIAHGDPYAVAISLNAIRRHLTKDQKRELIAKVLKGQPEKSNREIAVVVKADHKTVGSVRTEMEQLGKLPQLRKTRGKDGKSRPARKKKSPRPTPSPPAPNPVSVTESIGGTIEATAEAAPPPKDKAAKQSAHYLAEFTVACRSYLPKITTEADQQKARDLVAELIGAP